MSVCYLARPVNLLILDMHDDPDDIHSMVRRRFARIALDPASESRFPIGRESALALGYSAETLDAVADSCVARFAGVGNPLALGPVSPGATVLDVGAGSGLDALVAGIQVGPTGRVFGIDMTAEMVAAARSYRESSGVSNVEFRLGSSEDLPFASDSVDVVLSNGVINLCPDKERTLGEIHRVLRPGGGLYLADMFLDAEVSQATVQKVGSWSD